MRVAFAHWTAPCPDGRAELASEARVQPVDGAATRRLRMLWRMVGPFDRLVGAEALTTAVRRAEGNSARGTAPRLEAGETRHLVDDGVPSAMDAQAQPARQHLLRAHLHTPLPHVGHRQPVRLLLARRSLELEPVARGPHLHVPAVCVHACLSPGDRRNEAQHPLTQPHHDSCWGGAHTEDRQPSARKGHADVRVGKGVGLAPPPAAGKAGPPVLLRIRASAVQPQPPAADAGLALDVGREEHRVPVLRKSGNELGRPEAAERAPRPGVLPAEPCLHPRVVTHPYVQGVGRSPEDISRSGAEPLEVASRRRHRPMAEEAAGWMARATVAQDPPEP